MNIYSDIVIGDPHGIKDIDRVNGESLVLTRTNKAKKIIYTAMESNEITLRTTLVDNAIKGQTIDAKRKKWNAHYIAWEEMGFDIPDYPKSVKKYAIDVNQEEIEVAKKNFEQALSLDKYTSKDLLIKDANQYYRNIIMKENILKPVILAKKIIKKLYKGKIK
jgi:coenzyme F420 hydrogenase subunit beta